MGKTDIIDVLSLPRRHKINYGSLKENNLGTGLPINSLPGWEQIPLNLKLPMLKCPGNQVIFSKDKIGQSLLNQLKHNFDTSPQEKIPQYNALHDINLRNFYANENNLKRLRENGEITENNDVICTLKDFNEYRQQIHKSCIYYLLQELRRLDNEQNDRIMIWNAEKIANNDYANINLRSQSYHQILARRKRIEEERVRRYLILYEKSEEKFRRIAEKKKIDESMLQKKKYLNVLKMRQHCDAREEFQRKQFIKFKKQYQFKKQRFKRAVRYLMENKVNDLSDKQNELWKKRLDGRIAYQQHVDQLLLQIKEQRQSFIEQHLAKYRRKWEKIQMQIKSRTYSNKFRGKRRKKPDLCRRSVEYIASRKSRTIRTPSLSDERVNPPTTANSNKQESLLLFQLYNQNANRASAMDSHWEELNTDYSIFEIREMFNNMVDDELCQALNKAIDLQGNNNLPFDKNDPIYKVAQFIVHNIIKNFKKDLSSDKRVLKEMSARISSFFTEIKTFILYRASQIISAKREGVKENLPKFHDDTISRRPRLSHVSFSRFSSTIGISSYAINPRINLRDVASRKPTPAGSLASLLAADNQESPPRYDLSRTDIVVMEYFHVKFKRELIVNIGKRVFSAIQAHFAGDTTHVRKELLNIDKKYLSNLVAKAILSYTVSSINYDSAIRLCTSVLSADIIWSLQRQLLRPDRDKRGIVTKAKKASKDWLCLFFGEEYKDNYCCAPKEPTEGYFNEN